MDELRKQIRAEGENAEIAPGNLKQTIEREEKPLSNWQRSACFFTISIKLTCLD
ncbi:MAG: hypothetical protein U9N12_04395 [Euryarchaeota archaeon]|nr:hypothetical protein [Euryarchaeota archaeon]